MSQEKLNPQGVEREIGRILQKGDESVKPRTLSSSRFRFRHSEETSSLETKPVSLSQQEVGDILTANSGNARLVLNGITAEQDFDFFFGKQPIWSEEREFNKKQDAWWKEVSSDLSLLREVVEEEVAKTDLIAERFVAEHQDEIKEAQVAIRKSMKRYGVEIPSDLFEGVNFCGTWTYLAKRIKEAGEKELDLLTASSVGVYDPTTGEVDFLVRASWRTKKVDTQEVIKTYVHEILHKLSSHYFWEVTDLTIDQVFKDVKRSGLYFTDPRFGERMEELNEAVMETLARQICFEELKFPEDELRGWGFQVEGLEVVTQEAPFELFVRGAFTKKGFRDLYMTFEGRYGHFALLALARIIGKPHGVEQFIQNPKFREILLREEEYRLWEKRQARLGNLQ